MRYIEKFEEFEHDSFELIVYKNDSWLRLGTFFGISSVVDFYISPFFKFYVYDSFLTYRFFDSRNSKYYSIGSYGDPLYDACYVISEKPLFVPCFSKNSDNDFLPF